MAGKIINLAVVGYGYWGPNLVRNFSENENISLKYVCDLNKKRLEIVKKKYPSLKITSNYKRILNDKTIDAVAVATPTSTHFPLAKLALLSGKHIWIEKPFTENEAQAKELIHLAKTKKKIIFVDHIFLYTEAVQKIKEMIAKRKIGSIYYFDSTRINLGLFQPDTNVIWDLAPHDISIMLYFMDEMPKSVSVFASSHAMKNLEDTAYLSFKFKGRRTAHIRISWLSPVKIRQTLIAGTKKMIVYDDLESTEKIRIYDYGVSIDKTTKELSTNGYQYRTGDIKIPSIRFQETLQNACKAFVESINKNKAPISNGENGRKVVKIIQKAQESLKNGGIAIEVL